MPEQKKSRRAKREQLLQAAERLMLQRGFWGTSVDDVCAAASVSKGSFFHYFNSKEQLALATLDQFVHAMVCRVREAVASREPGDAYGRICAYCDLVAGAAAVQDAQEGCLIAAFVMELRFEDSTFAERCSTHFGGWIELLRQEFVAALASCKWANPAMPAELAQLCICVVEGALILARGRNDPLIVRCALEHFKCYVRSLLTDTDGDATRAARVRIGQASGRAGGPGDRSARAGARHESSRSVKRTVSMGLAGSALMRSRKGGPGKH